MGQKKLQRFEEIKSFPNVLQYPTNMKGNWKTVFGNDNPITLELACGKGEYTVALAEMYPSRNFIGVDLKGNRLWVGAKHCLNKELKNAVFLRTQIEMIDHYFASDEVDEIWITFPDPQLRLKRAKKRLTHPHFLRLYQKFLRPGGIIHLKTDSPDLYNFTKLVIDLYHLEVKHDIDDVNAAENLNDELRIKTYYEGLDIAGSKTIFYISFMLTGTLVDEDDKLKEIIQSASSYPELPHQDQPDR